MEQIQRHTNDLIAEATRLIEEGQIKKPADLGAHFTMEELAYITNWLLQHFTQHPS